MFRQYALDCVSQCEECDRALCGVGDETPTPKQRHRLCEHRSYAVRMRDAAIKWHRRARGSIDKVDASSLKNHIEEARKLKAAKAKHRRTVRDRVHRSEFIDRFSPKLNREHRRKALFNSKGEASTVPMCAPKLPGRMSSARAKEKWLTYEPGKLEHEFFVHEPRRTPSRRFALGPGNLAHTS